MKATYGEIGHPVNVEVVDGKVIGTLANGEKIEIDDVTLEAFNIGLGEEGLHQIEPREIFKDPLTDRDPVTGLSIKKSAKGLLQVVKVDGVYQLIDQVTDEQEAEGELKEVYSFGELVIDPTLAEIRQRVNDNVLQLLNV